MKLCFSTLGCPDWSFEKVVSEAWCMGYSAIEVRGIGDALPIDQIPALRPENQEKTQALLSTAGIRIASLNTSATLQDPATLPAALAETKAALAVANRMNVPAIRVFGDSRPNDKLSELSWRLVADGLLAMCDAAQSMGAAQIWLEIHGAINTVEILTPILDLVGSHPSFGIIWDIEHSFKPVGNDIDAFYELVRPYTKHTHIKDCKKTPSGYQCVLPGEGDIDIAKIVERLQSDGFAGCYSFEWEKRWHKELPDPELAFPAYVKFMEQIGK